MMQTLFGLISGVMFGLGLAVSGMTQPAKVLGFLDFTGNWDPSLICVMAGAIGTFAPLYRFITQRMRPRYAAEFTIYRGKQLDAPLVVGSLVFGIGWGLAGYCPGPGVVSAGSLAGKGVVFAISMLLGMVLFRLAERALAVFRERGELVADG